MPEPTSGPSWSAWVLGDLVDSVRLVSDTLGAFAPAVSIRVTAPPRIDDFDCMPMVTIATRNRSQHEQLRDALIKAESVPEHLSVPAPDHCSAVLGNLYLVLTVEEHQ